MEWETTLGPLLSSLGLELYDVEFAGGTLNVVVNRPGGVDVDALTSANRAIGEWLDATDPISGHFTLDVSSPGLERRLRTIAHFKSAVGELVTLRELRDGESTRRLEGTLVAVDGSTLELDESELGRLSIPLASVERARTVFNWGTTKPEGRKNATTPSTSTKG